jgi:hypothetical protein
MPFILQKDFVDKPNWREESLFRQCVNAEQVSRMKRSFKLTP